MLSNAVRNRRRERRDNDLLASRELTRQKAIVLCRSMLELAIDYDTVPFPKVARWATEIARWKAGSNDF